jgi:hypothetical protein
VKGPYGTCITVQQQCDQQAVQLFQQQMNAAYASFQKSVGIGISLGLGTAALAGCTVGAFTGSIASLIFTDGFGFPLLGPVGCLGGASIAVLDAFPATALLSVIGAGIQYYGDQSAAKSQFQQNWQNCGN